ncbi:MAG: hypothetical protein ABIH18_08240, partial [Candidatus Omnitrophota bacterium]
MTLEATNLQLNSYVKSHQNFGETTIFITPDSIYIYVEFKKYLLYIKSLLQNTSNLSFCGSPRGEAEGLTAESIKILSSIIDPALSRRMTEIE